ncbi:MAG: hypothetical protein JNK04_04885 [Myxococcales bacterium]|nr:hypothetical protein [Myxococcales bacterium]
MRFLHSITFATALVLTSTGCSQTVILTPDASVPFAHGELDPSFEDNGNGEMTLRVEHLGEPNKLSSNATVYVVWVQPKAEDAPIQNVGVLSVDDSYAGELTFKTSFQSFVVSVTPEAAATVTKPEGKAVLTGTVAK